MEYLRLEATVPRFSFPSLPPFGAFSALETVADLRLEATVPRFSFSSLPSFGAFSALETVADLRLEAAGVPVSPLLSFSPVDYQTAHY